MHHSKSDANHEKTIGPFIGTLIILILLVIGALYMWAQKLNEDEQRRAQFGDDLKDIQRELRDTDIKGLDSSARQIQ